MATRRPAGPPDVLTAKFAADPYAAYRVMREDFPLIRHEATDSYLISRYEDVQRAFKDPVFTSGFETSDKGVFTRGPVALPLEFTPAV